MIATFHAPLLEQLLSPLPSPKKKKKHNSNNRENNLIKNTLLSAETMSLDIHSEKTSVPLRTGRQKEYSRNNGIN